MAYKSLLFILLAWSCSEQGKEKPAAINGDSVTEKTIEPPQQRQSDTLVITSKTAVFYEPDSIQIAKRKKEIGEENFRIGFDDYAFSVNSSIEFLEKEKLPVVDAKDKKYLKFIKANRTSRIIKIDSLADLWGIYLFDPSKEPYSADMTIMDEEFEQYFRKY